MKSAFHEDAWMFFIDEAGTLVKVPLDDQHVEWLAKHEQDNYFAELHMLSVHQMGDAAFCGPLPLELSGSTFTTF